ncbi:MAG: D-2-hydroxyacid dehydrogenase [Campylobacteraceae bacterium]|jgi:glycerate dehydrogenase|nr:D-2-hydroxyacid dehydrogenase [Campylobacteraceae bacterium]MBT3882499.1 D-2-hydroxyacid dehydrogenase [Campylobacteraceae bacterium]MBT4030998.1 D-2-hydroxyacid dehydrogenase [Campylobacteraceae bacterium]MBT4178879.1 D-2-hydroxyacid dehydrogenase [Campylobacteraceae bacterium]MBT4571996.1 D-2-hydroxyacid dehydrogenase [Campylobacteraceae bacterium]
MKIVFLDRKTLGDDICLSEFSKSGEVFYYDSTKEYETLDRVKDADIIITNKVVINKDIMDNSNIKLICVAATGMNNIDLEYASQKDIIVKNVAGYSTASVAQLTLSFALQFINQISYYDNYVKNKGWENSDIFTHLDKPFYDLENKTWGIIGLGSIGEQVANIASALGCKVQYYSTSGKNVNDIYSQVDLETLLSTSDVISIHSPLNEQTLNLINQSNLSQIKDKAILLNLGRGGIVNEQDISEELDKREIYFATDVVSKEPIEKNSPLLKINNKNRILFTPHIAWASKEARVRLVDGIINNIKNYING